MKIMKIIIIIMIIIIKMKVIIQIIIIKQTERRSPAYSTTNSPFLKGLVATTPLPFPSTSTTCPMEV